MAPVVEKDEMLVTVRVWHKAPARARRKKARQAPVLVKQDAPALEAAMTAEQAPVTAEQAPAVAAEVAKTAPAHEKAAAKHEAQPKRKAKARKETQAGQKATSDGATSDSATTDRAATDSAPSDDKAAQRLKGHARLKPPARLKLPKRPESTPVTPEKAQSAPPTAPDKAQPQAHPVPPEWAPRTDPLPQRATTRPEGQRATAAPGGQRTTGAAGPAGPAGPAEARRIRSGRPWPPRSDSDGQPSAPADPRRGWGSPPSAQRTDARALEVSHDSEPGRRGPAQAGPPAVGPPAAGPAWPQAPAISSQPQARWFLRAQAPPPVAPPESAEPFPPLPPDLGPEPVDEHAPRQPEPVEEHAPRQPEPAEPAAQEPATEAPEPSPAEATAEVPAPPQEHAPPSAPEVMPEAPAPPHREVPRVAAKFVDLDADRPLPSIERALSGPGRHDQADWGRRVKVVTGGQGPGRRDTEALARDRARLPLPGPRRIAVLGCTGGAGQTVTVLMTGHILAALREVPVAALDLNPGRTSLATHQAPSASVTALLGNGTNGNGRPPEGDAGPGLDVIAAEPGLARTLEVADYRRLAALLASRYPLTIIDPAPSGVMRELSVADQLVLVAPASPDAATSLANTQQWLAAHGYGELAARAVTLVNGVNRQTMDNVLRAESVARGRCRAIVRVPWDDHLLTARAGTPAALLPQTRLAYTALAGVLIAGMAAVPITPVTPVPGRNPGEHSD